jgi:D-psicose/D-tagatose/L-ribulose 3-epimerase|tara:strand:+ start:127 stop:966 length:840 start_codon:yes stop_codon:yes gene_type:complete
MKIGFNMLLWTTNLVEEEFYLLEKIKKVGYDGIEIPLFGGEVDHYKKIGQALNDNGLESTSVTVIPDQSHNPISENAKDREGAVEHLKWAIDCSDAIGSKLLCGPFHQPLGEFSGNPPTSEEKERAAEVHQQASDYAKNLNISLSIEPLNRFECYFLNTIEDTSAYVDMVNRDNFGLLFDTFHSNIEEKDPVRCIEVGGKRINHIHISENDRGTPGKGHVPWKETFAAIKNINYDGWLTIEAFGRALPDLAAATRVWRDFFPFKEEVYEQGYEFIKKNI